MTVYTCGRKDAHRSFFVSSFFLCAGDEEEEEEEEDGVGGVLKPRSISKEEQEKREADYLEWLKGNEVEVVSDKKVRPARAGCLRVSFFL